MINLTVISVKGCNAFVSHKITVLSLSTFLKTFFCKHLGNKANGISVG